MKMYLFLASILMAVMLTKSDVSPELITIAAACRSETGIPHEKVQSPVNADDYEVKCFLSCINRMSGNFMDGKLVLEKELEFIEKMFSSYSNNDKNEEIAACIDTANMETDECVISAVAHKCLVNLLGISDM